MERWCVLLIVFVGSVLGQICTPSNLNGQCFGGGGIAVTTLSGNYAAGAISDLPDRNGQGQSVENVLNALPQVFGATCGAAAQRVACSMIYSRCSVEQGSVSGLRVQPCRDICDDFINACSGVENFASTLTSAGVIPDNIVDDNNAWEMFRDTNSNLCNDGTIFATTQCSAISGDIRCASNSAALVPRVQDCSTVAISNLRLVAGPTIFETTTESVVVTLQTSRAARIWCIPRRVLNNPNQPENPTALTGAQIRSASPADFAIYTQNCGSNLLCDIRVSGLQAATTYYIDCMAQDTDMAIFGSNIRIQATTQSQINTDNTPPRFTINGSPTVTSITSTSLTITGTLNENSLMACIATTNSNLFGFGAAAPSLNEIRNQIQNAIASHAVCSPNAPCVVRFGQLQPGATYRVWCSAEDFAVNTVNVNTVDLGLQTTPADLTEPRWEMDAFVADHTPTCITVTARINELGFLYCAAVSNNAQLTNQQIIQRGAASLCNPDLDCTVEVTKSVVFQNQVNNPIGLQFVTPSTAYTVRCAVADIAGNINSNSAELLAVTDATDDNTPPSFIETPQVEGTSQSAVMVSTVLNEDARMFCVWSDVGSQPQNVNSILSVDYPAYTNCQAALDCNVAVSEISSPQRNVVISCAIVDVAGNANPNIAQINAVTSGIPDRVATGWGSGEIVVSAYALGFDITVTVGEPGAVYCVALTDPNTNQNRVLTPMEVAATAGAVRADCRGNTVSCNLELTGLNRNTIYDIYCSNWDAQGNVNPVVLDRQNARTTTNNNIAAPSWSQLGTPTVANTDFHTITVRADINLNQNFRNELGNGMFGCLASVDGVVANNGANAPGAARIRDTAAPSMCSITNNNNAQASCILTLQGLTEGTNYDIFCAIWDRNENVNADVRRLPSATTGRSFSNANWRRDPVVESVDEDSITVWGVVNKPFTMRCGAIARINNNTPVNSPNRNDIVDLPLVGSTTCVSFEACMVTIGNLNPNTRYDIFCTAFDAQANNNRGTREIRAVDTTNRDITSPNYVIAPEIDGTTLDRTLIEVRVALNEVSTFGCVGIPSNNVNALAAPTTAAGVFTWVRPNNVPNLGNTLRSSTACRASPTDIVNGDAVECVLSLPNLSPDTLYTIYCAVRDLRGNIRGANNNNSPFTLSTRTSATIEDINPPRWTITGVNSIDRTDLTLTTASVPCAFPNQGTGCSATITATARLSEPGSLRCVATMPGDHAIRAADVFDTADQASTNPVCVGNELCRVTISGLTLNTKYAIQCAVQDNRGNINYGARRAYIETPNTNNVRCGDLSVGDGEMCELGSRQACTTVHPEIYNAGYAACIGCRAYNTITCTRRGSISPQDGLRPRFF